MSARRLHGGCPPLEGEKWSANVWVWNRPRKTPDRQKRLVIFRNIETTTTMDIYWDSTSSIDANKAMEFGEIATAFRGDQSSGLTRFKHMGKLAPNGELRRNSFPGHVFIAVDIVTNEVLFTSSVEKSNGKVQDEQIILFGRR